MAEKYNPNRDLNPTPEARAAMYLFGAEYSKSHLGSMGFWDQLPDHKKALCERLVEDISKAAKSHGRATPSEGE